VAEQHDTLVSAFEAGRRDAAFGPNWLGRAREAAFARFLERGFPTTRDEDWRFTNVAPIAKTAFERAAAAAAPAALEGFRLNGAASAEIVVANGRVVPSESALGALPRGVTLKTGVSSLVPETWVQGPEGRALAPSPFVDLNTAFFEDAVVIEIAPRAVVRAPVHIILFSDAGARPTIAAARIVVLAGEQAQASIVETWIGRGGVSLTTAVTAITAGPGAVVDHIKLQAEGDEAFHMAGIFARLMRSATLRSHAITLGGRIARNDIVATLDGDGAECTLNGLYVAGGDSLVDTHTTIDHAKPHCPSHELYKGILAGRSRAVFNGKIIVRPDAQKTDAKQTNKALLLTDDAQVNTKPQLEIFADDVKCTHGAAIGQLDEEGMFYLTARGIAAVDARNMLIHAFAGEVLDRIAIQPVRERAMRLMERKLRLPEDQPLEQS
jgi:Fe-S cluster assembly protein SufD